MTIRSDDAFRRTIAEGLVAIRDQFDVPGEFPALVEQEAADRVRRPLTSDRVDLTALPFLTLDPDGATDLDQAFALERVGDQIRIRYAIADVGWFVAPGSPLDREAWQRGATVYLPDGRAPVYPTALSEGGASLLPDGPRPAIVLDVLVDPAGTATLETAHRAIVHSRAQLAYETVTAAQLPPELVEVWTRVTAAEDRRGASRVEFPEQEVAEAEAGDYRLAFRDRRPAEDQNATLSLAANLAVAQTLLAAGTGLFRTMAGPEPRELGMLRRAAASLGIDWPRSMELADFQRHLPATPAAAAFLLAVRRAGRGAGYEPFSAGVVPWHAAIAASYVHATAPLRRLADRYVLEATCAITAGREVPDWVREAFGRLPDAMRRADERAAKVDRAVLDLVEAATLHGHEGRRFDAVVTDIDERGARIQLTDPAVVARLDGDDPKVAELEPGVAIRVRLTAADPKARRVSFVAEGILPIP